MSPKTAIVVLTMERDRGFMREAYAGANGYVLKEAAATELVSAIRRAAQEKPRISVPGFRW